MKKGFAYGLAILVLGYGQTAVAQRSLFEQPPAEASSPAAPVQASPAGEAPRAKPRPRKPRGPVPARSLTITNASANTLTGLEVSAEGRTAKMTRPLASQKKATLKLPAFKSCTVTVAAAFDGQGQAESSAFDICKDKVIRFTD